MFIDNVGSLVAKTFFPSKSNDVLELSLQSVDTLEWEVREVQEYITYLDANMSYPLY